MCFTCRGGSRGAQCLTKLWLRVGPLKKDPHGRGGEGGGRGSWDHMSSNDVGSYEFKRSPCEMQMDLS